MKRQVKRWFALGLGLVGGLFYGVSETLLDRYTLGSNSDLSVLHNAIEWTMPVLIGITLSFIVSVYFYQRELNRKLSGEMSALKSKILTNTFASYILHEIRNPIHNLNAVLEKHAPQYPDSERDIMERNMKKLTAITNQLRHMHVLSDHMNVRQAVAFSPWLDTFLKDSVEGALRKFKIHYEQKVSSLRLSMHPLLLEQCFQLLFDNAIRVSAESSQRLMSLSATLDENKKGCAKIVLRNSGALFSEEIVHTSGRTRVGSQEGSGLGLVLVRDTLKHVGGEMLVENKDGVPQVTLCIPLEDVVL
jgi:signal transduction histidine kinase